MSLKEILEALSAEGKTTEVASIQREIELLQNESKKYREKNQQFKEFLGLDDTGDLDEKLKAIKAQNEKAKLEAETAEQARLASMTESQREFEVMKNQLLDLTKANNEVKERETQAIKKARQEQLKNVLGAEFDKAKVLPSVKADLLDIFSAKVKDDGTNFAFEFEGAQMDLTQGVAKYLETRKHFIGDTQNSGSGTGTNTTTPTEIKSNIPFVNKNSQSVLDAMRKGD